MFLQILYVNSAHCKSLIGKGLSDPAQRLSQLSKIGEMPSNSNCWLKYSTKIFYFTGKAALKKPNLFKSMENYQALRL